VFGNGVDRRSVERVVGAVGDEIGLGGCEKGDGEEGDGGHGDGELESLEIEVAWDGPDAEADEVRTSFFPRRSSIYLLAHNMLIYGDLTLTVVIQSRSSHLTAFPNLTDSENNSRA